jgi:hypothetical protein
LAQARQEDKINGYWAGVHDGLEKALTLPLEYLDKTDEKNTDDPERA